MKETTISACGKNLEENCLAIAIENKNLEMVDLLIKSGVDLEVQNKFGNTALITACANDSLEIVNLLIESGANLEAKNTHHETCFISSCELGNLEIVDLLIKSGANIESQNADGYTGFMLAVENEILEMVDLLLKSGANMKASDTPIMLACQKNNFKMVDLLIKSGIYIDTKNVKIQEYVLEKTEIILTFNPKACDPNTPRNDKYFNDMCDILVLFSEYDFYVPHREQKNQEHMYKKNCQKLKAKFQIKIQQCEIMQNTMKELWTAVDSFVLNIIFDFTHGYKKLQNELEILECNFLS